MYGRCVQTASGWAIHFFVNFDIFKCNGYILVTIGSIYTKLEDFFVKLVLRFIT